MSSFHPHLLDRRLRVARAVVWAIIGVFVVVFFRTQILEHGKYRLQSELNRLRPIPLPAPRGLIMDRNGKVLAEKDRKSTRLNSSHGYISYAVFCLKKKKKHTD